MIKKPLYVLGISESHTATAALLKDGEIIACASEERFTRKKLQAGFPKRAVEFCLNFAKISPQDIDRIVVSDINPLIFDTVQKPPIKPPPIANLFLDFENLLETNFPFFRNISYAIYKKLMQFNIPLLKQKRLKSLQQYFQLPKEKFYFLPHHLCHASSALFSSTEFSFNKPTLIFTCDGVGDFESATLSKSSKGKIKKLVTIDSQQSLGFFFLHITQFLGLKPIEDEYKVMGLAPYANPKKAKKLYEKLMSYFRLDSNKNLWIMKFNEYHFPRKFAKIFAFQRFDDIAYAAQLILEEILTQSVKTFIKRFKINTFCFGGGVFSNVKVNQKIASLKDVKYAFFMPSPSDDSNAIGAAYYAYYKMTKLAPKSLNNLYLGPSYTTSDIEKVIKKKSIRYKISKPRDLNLKVAYILTKGEVVARFVGKMEFGSRALGNRSILARPDDLSIIPFINSAIKKRDFWMPFAPTILRERAKDYLIMHKADSLFMNVAFDTTEKGKVDLAAAIHSYDKTTRPQILYKDTNPNYYDLIKKFEKLTGIGAVLNTSFNLHGEPIVCSPEDALKTFLKSGLKHLSIGDWLLTK